MYLFIDADDNSGTNGGKEDNSKASGSGTKKHKVLNSLRKAAPKSTIPIETNVGLNIRANSKCTMICT